MTKLPEGIRARITLINGDKVDVPKHVQSYHLDDLIWNDRAEAYINGRLIKGSDVVCIERAS